MSQSVLRNRCRAACPGGIAQFGSCRPRPGKDGQGHRNEFRKRQCGRRRAGNPRRPWPGPTRATRSATATTRSRAVWRRSSAVCSSTMSPSISFRPAPPPTRCALAHLSPPWGAVLCHRAGAHRHQRSRRAGILRRRPQAGRTRRRGRHDLAGDAAGRARRRRVGRPAPRHAVGACR